MARHPQQQYLDGTYAEHNPSWDSVDSRWKAEKVSTLLPAAPRSICEVGCGGGGVIAALREVHQDTVLTGYDISPDAQQFWQQHEGCNIDFHVGDFLVTEENFEIILLLDVLEHLADPHDFLISIRERAQQFIFHFPLDLSALSVLRESPLMYVRKKVGHIHYFTKGLALALLDECGFEVLDWDYTGAAFNSPQAGIRTKLAKIPRYLAYAANKDFGVRLLGGETLMVLAKPKVL
ncbi:MAG: class I SAM-dependent methyltransferase [Gammaproteobacteria bacterium]|nr:MAG: class I SAM-dependent methyltransferase [Gammaproteobacteria bacterium]